MNAINFTLDLKSGESVSDFLSALKTLAHTCNFGNTLTDMLRDRFVMGLANETTQQLLLTEPDLSFNKAVDMATTHEAALRDVQAMGGAPVHKVQSQSKLGSSQFSSSKSRQSGNKFNSKPPNSNSNSKHSDTKPKTLVPVVAVITGRKPVHLRIPSAMDVRKKDICKGIFNVISL